MGLKEKEEEEEEEKKTKKKRPVPRHRGELRCRDVKMGGNGRDGGAMSMQLTFCSRHGGLP